MAKNLDFIKKLGEELFEKRSNLLTLWQTLAENFYPERADFTTVRSLGDEFASQLMSSYPVLARRDLGNSFGSMLRPTSKDWFKIITDRQEKLGIESKAMLEWMTGLQKRAMYDTRSMFVRATSEGDMDFATFGQCVIQVQMNMEEMALLFRCWNLRDVAWQEDKVGQVGTIIRRWKATASTLVATFGADRVHDKVNEAIKNKKPFTEFMVWHCIVPREIYGDDEYKQPWVSIYYDKDNNHEIECVGSLTKQYVIPRWQTVSGSQYAYSPATIVALPDARLIQAMTRVLLEAGEKAVDPPMLATQDMVWSDISIYAGGVTWVDAEYDERLGEVLRPISQNINGIPLGLEMAQDVRGLITEAFYLNKLSLPHPDTQMTAFEVGHRVQEYIRQALPLFEPMEMEYNGAVCNEAFDVLMNNGAFGAPHDFPKDLKGRDIQFQFESPLKEATEREKGQRFLEAKEMLASAIDLDPSAAYIIDASKAVRDVLEGIGVPVSWNRSEAAVTQMAKEIKAAEQAQNMLAQMKDGAAVAKDLSQASRVAPNNQQQAVPAMAA